MDVDGSRGLLGFFAQVPDPGSANVRHRLADLLAITVLAVLSRGNDWVEIAAWGAAQQPWLKTFLDLPHGVASHDTFDRVFRRLDPVALEQCFMAFVAGVAQHSRGRLIAIDGKSLRGSFQAGAKRTPIHMVSAWCTHNQMVLGQLACDAKSNEITAIPRLLELLDLRDAVVSIDAMGCQKAIAAQIVKQKGDYLLAVKDNQPTLHEAVAFYFDEAIQAGWKGLRHRFARDVYGDHGRIETRRCWATADVGWLKGQGQDWPGLGGLVCVESEREVLGSDLPVAAERRYFITSVDPRKLSGDELLALVRRHWGIENQLHWCLDVVFAEDASRVRKDHGGENLSRMRRLTLNLVRQMRKVKPGTSLKVRRLMCSWDHQLLLDTLTGKA